MPELPEVEVVRRGLDRWVSGRTISRVEVLGARSVRRHEAGARDFADRLRGRTITSAQRRGKFLWFPLDGPTDAEPDEAVVAHLGMSGQLLMQPTDEPDEKHLHVRVKFDDDGRELRFVDQRTFGGLHLDTLEKDRSSNDRSSNDRSSNDRVSGRLVPTSALHIAADPLEEAFDVDRLARALRRRTTGIKRAMLDQSLVSGIGNIYADEALWRSRMHYARSTSACTRAQVCELMDHTVAVMTSALAQGGTSFDSLYVDVNGSSGYFERSLDAYGREGRPCHRCGRMIVREAFMNRSSFRCPSCQRVSRSAHW